MASKSVTLQLLSNLPQVGRLEWIGVRPERGAAMESRKSAEVTVGGGLVGDRFKGSEKSPRQITLMQFEHISAISSFLHGVPVSPFVFRRNLVVSGVNLLALKNKRFFVGDVLFETTGLCHPCHKMELFLGEGGYNAMRGHGGITARVIRAGKVNLNDRVKIADDAG